VGDDILNDWMAGGTPAATICPRSFLGLSVPGETFSTLFTSALHHPCHPPDESRFAKKVDNVSPGTDTYSFASPPDLTAAVILESMNV